MSLDTDAAVNTKPISALSVKKFITQASKRGTNTVSIELHYAIMAFEKSSITTDKHIRQRQQTSRPKLTNK